MTTETLRQLEKALYQYEHAVDAVNATAESDDPHASTLAVLEYNRAAEVLKTWSQPEYLRQLINALASAPAQPLAWIYEDELPDGYPYEAMFPYSKVDVVRMFPVYGPSAPAQPVANQFADASKMVPLREVSLTRDVNGMCVVTVNGKEVIRDNGDIISHYATPDWFSTLSAQAAPKVPDGWKLLKDTTQAERSWPEDSSHENGNYSNACIECGRMFIGHKRRGVCKVCAAPQPPAPSEQRKPDAATVDRVMNHRAHWRTAIVMMRDYGHRLYGLDGDADRINWGQVRRDFESTLDELAGIRSTGGEHE